uniref:Uncharacterized protein n=1 Tax=Quercus lobata TaxID=97700 RepID=A0A7N2ML28_QUELO
MRGKARGEAAMKSARQAPKNPRKNNNKKANNAESVAEAVSSSVAAMEIEKAPEAAKPKDRAALGKLLLRSVSVRMFYFSLERMSLKNDLLPITSMHLLINQPPWRLKCPKYQPRRKNLAKGLLLHRRRSPWQLEIEVVATPEARKKGGGKLAANAKAVKAPAAAKKRGAANKQQPQTLAQKLLTDMLKPAENSRISLEKKVRKMRASPFNKKSGSVLGRVGKQEQDLKG